MCETNRDQPIARMNRNRILKTETPGENSRVGRLRKGLSDSGIKTFILVLK